MRASVQTGDEWLRIFACYRGHMATPMNGGMRHILNEIAESTGDLATAISADGVFAGIRYLNGRVPHRCTAIYKLEDNTVRCLYLHDKQGELTPAFLAVVPLDDSYCQFVLRDGYFGSDNTPDDRRLDGNPHQGVIVSYHGVPIVDAAGKLFGTLCHFDMVPHTLADDEFAFFQMASAVFTPYLCGLLEGGLPDSGSAPAAFPTA